MARRQSENYPEIRREILRHSATLFAAKGYANASIADLAEANDMSRGLLYHYFASKEAILKEMLNEHLDVMLAETRSAAKTGATAAERFRNTVRSIVTTNARSKDLQIVLLHDLKNLKPTDRSAVVRKQRGILAVLGALIAENDSAGRTSARTIKVYTMMFVGMINYTYLWYDPDGPVGAAEYAEMVTDTCLRGLKGA